jgi:hypothetical protein
LIRDEGEEKEDENSWDWFLLCADEVHRLVKLNAAGTTVSRNKELMSIKRFILGTSEENEI